MSVLKVDLRANRMEEKVARNKQKGAHFWKAHSKDVPEGVSPLLRLTRAFRPHERYLFSLWKKDLYRSQLYLIHNALAWKRGRNLNPEAAPRNDEKWCERAYCSDIISFFKFNQVYPRRTPPKILSSELRAWGRVQSKEGSQGKSIYREGWGGVMKSRSFPNKIARCKMWAAQGSAG